jgi:hypothetical protein
MKSDPIADAAGAADAADAAEACLHVRDPGGAGARRAGAARPRATPMPPRRACTCASPAAQARGERALLAPE